MAKITIVRNTAHPRGARLLCTRMHARWKVQCTKTRDHAGKCAWTEPPKKELPARKRTRISNVTKLDCLQMIEDPRYRQQLLKDLRARTLRPAVECMLWYYAKGKPKELIEHSGKLTLEKELAELSDAELAARATEIAGMIDVTPAVKKIVH